jgi:hypothetical protein
LGTVDGLLTGADLSNEWHLNGNTNASIKTLGTTDNFDLPIITAGTEKMRITTAGNVGIGNTTPTTKLDIAGSTPGAIKIADGTQNNGYVLTSDNTGVGQWKAPALFLQLGTLGTGATIFSTTGEKYVNTGSFVILPPGKWAVRVTMLLYHFNAAGTNATTSDPNEVWWVRTTFSNSPTPLATPALPNSEASADIYGTSKLVSGLLPGNSMYGMLDGIFLIDNSTSSNKTYYYFAGFAYSGGFGGSQNLNGTIYRFGGNYSGENIKKLFDFTKKNGGIDYAYEKIDACISAAEEIVNEFAFDNEMKEMMRLLLRYLRSRRY